MPLPLTCAKSSRQQATRLRAPSYLHRLLHWKRTDETDLWRSNFRARSSHFRTVKNQKPCDQFSRFSVWCIWEKKKLRWIVSFSSHVIARSDSVHHSSPLCSMTKLWIVSRNLKVYYSHKALDEYIPMVFVLFIRFIGFIFLQNEIYIRKCDHSNECSRPLH